MLAVLSKTMPATGDPQAADKFSMGGTSHPAADKSQAPGLTDFMPGLDNIIHPAIFQIE